jgi:cytidylate kinase
LAADRGKQEKTYASLAEALEASQNRMSRLKQRLLNVYHVDFTDTSHYTKVIDTTGKTFDQNLKELDDYITSLKK